MPYQRRSGLISIILSMFLSCLSCCDFIRNICFLSITIIFYYLNCWKSTFSERNFQLEILPGASRLVLYIPVRKHQTWRPKAEPHCVSASAFVPSRLNTGLCHTNSVPSAGRQTRRYTRKELLKAIACTDKGMSTVPG